MKKNVWKIIFWGAISLLIGTYWYITSGQSLIRNYIAQSWKQVSCTITDVSVGTEASVYGPGYKGGQVALYRPIVKYDFFWQGKKYSSDVYNFFFQKATGGALGPRFSDTADLARSYKVGSDSSCYGVVKKQVQLYLLTFELVIMI